MEKVGAYTDRATEIGEWRPGNPGLGQQATPMLATYFNMLQRELVGVVEGADIELDSEDDGQLLQAISELCSWVRIAGKPTTLSGFGITDALRVRVAIAGDLDTYKSDIRGSGSALVNAPNGDAGFWYIDVQSHGAGGAYCRQMAWRVTGALPESFVRHNSNGVWTLWEKILTGSAVPLPTGYFTGFTLSNHPVNAGTAITVAAGAARDTADLVNIKLSGTLNCTLQAAGAWASGDNQNKLDTGIRAANSWYHVHAIRRATDGAADIVLSLSATAPAMPAGYVGARRIGSIRTGSDGNILGFLNVGRQFTWKTPPLDVNVSGSVVDAAYVLSVPTGVRVMAQLGGGLIAGEAFWSYRATDSNAIAPSYTAYVGGVGMASNSVDYMAHEVTVLTNTAAQAHFRTEFAASPFRVVTYGWAEI